jgi:hypothetical protein
MKLNKDSYFAEMARAKSREENDDFEKPPNPFDIDRSIFNKQDQRTQELQMQLSEKYMVYKDLADRCIINPTLTGKKLLRPSCFCLQIKVTTVSFTSSRRGFS